MGNRMELTNSFLPTFECRRRLYVTSVDSHTHRPHTHTQRERERERERERQTDRQTDRLKDRLTGLNR